MGHLVNPIAFRMGWASNWIDLFYVDRKYYPQYLHMLFRIRLVINVIFKGHWFERQGGFFYSHFLLAKDYTGLSLTLYFYDGKTEAFFFQIEDYIQEDRDYLFANDAYHERKSDNFFSFYVYFIFFRLFNSFFITSEWFLLLSKHRTIEKIAEAFFLFDKRLMHSALQLPEEGLPAYIDCKSEAEKETFISLAKCKTTTIRFFWFYLLCKDLATAYDKEDVYMGTTHQDFVQQFVFIYTTMLRNTFSFKVLCPYLFHIMGHLTKDHRDIPMDVVSTSFMVITNENITAPFIARYIALKLEQGFTTRGLLNPLRAEFTRLLKLEEYHQKEVNFPFDYLVRKYANRNYFSSLFRTILKSLSIIYARSNNALLSSNKTYLNLDSFIFLYHIFKKFQVYGSLMHRRIFSLSSKYNRYYFYFSFFNYNKVAPYYSELIEKLFLDPKDLKFHSKPERKLNLAKFPLILPKLLFNSFENHSDWSGKSWAIYNYALLLIFLNTFNSKMHYFYSQQNYYYLGKAVLAKNRLLRLHNPATNPEVRYGFRGFKVQCLGRFTRRQRSAKLTWSQNSMPLNTMSAFIDYGSYNVVLKNSLINVKVWFYKDKGFSEYYLKLC